MTGPILPGVLNARSTCTDSQLPLKESHIHLLHKTGDRDLLKNKRPLSMIDTDERLFSQALNCRLAHELHRIIEPTQTAFNPGRRIDDNIAAMQCAVETPTALAPDGMVALLDFEKAYDRIAHVYLDKKLVAFDFGI